MNQQKKTTHISIIIVSTVSHVRVRVCVWYGYILWRCHPCRSIFLSFPVLSEVRFYPSSMHTFFPHFPCMCVCAVFEIKGSQLFNQIELIVFECSSNIRSNERKKNSDTRSFGTHSLPLHFPNTNILLVCFCWCQCFKCGKKMGIPFSFRYQRCFHSWNKRLAWQKWWKLQERENTRKYTVKHTLWRVQTLFICVDVAFTHRMLIFWNQRHLNELWQLLMNQTTTMRKRKRDMVKPSSPTGDFCKEKEKKMRQRNRERERESHREWERHRKRQRQREK